MKKINWWKVASVAMMAASAILSFGHDLIEEQRSEEEMQDMVREEVQRQLAEKTGKREKYSLLYGRDIQTDKQRRLIFMKHIDWWKVASIAMMAASAILSFGHDLIEDQRSEEELQDMVQEEVRRQLAEKNL